MRHGLQPCSQQQLSQHEHECHSNQLGTGQQGRGQLSSQHPHHLDHHSCSSSSSTQHARSDQCELSQGPVLLPLLPGGMCYEASLACALEQCIDLVKHGSRSRSMAAASALDDTGADQTALSAVANSTSTEIISSSSLKHGTMPPPTTPTCTGPMGSAAQSGNHTPSTSSSHTYQPCLTLLQALCDACLAKQPPSALLPALRVLHAMAVAPLRALAASLAVAGPRSSSSTPSAAVAVGFGAEASQAPGPGIGALFGDGAASGGCSSSSTDCKAVASRPAMKLVRSTHCV